MEFIFLLLLCQPIFDHVTAHIREAKIPSLESVSEPFVVDTETVEKRSVEVIDVNGLVLDSPTNLVGLSVCLATLDAASCHEHGKAERVVIPSGDILAASPVFAQWGSSKFR